MPTTFNSLTHHSTDLAEMQRHSNSANLMQMQMQMETMQRNFLLHSYEEEVEVEAFPPNNNYNNTNLALPRQLIMAGSGPSSALPKCSTTTTTTTMPNIGSSEEKQHAEDDEEDENGEGSLTTRAEITSVSSRKPSRKRRTQQLDSKISGGESEDSSITKRQKLSDRNPCSQQQRGKVSVSKGAKSLPPPPDCKNNSASPASKDSNKQSKSGAPAPVTQDYVHVRARRGQATDSHSLAERVRREKISERMRFLQDLVPGCNKAIGKAMMLDEIINYVQSLQHQVEFLSMKLAALSPRMDFDIDSLLIGEMMLSNGVTANSTATTTSGSDIAEAVQMGNMCDMVYNPSASNMSFQMLLQSPLPPDSSTNIGDPTSLPIKACQNAMLNNANMAINLDQSYIDPQFTSTWDPRSMPGRENIVFYGNSTVSMTEPVGNPLL